MKTWVRKSLKVGVLSAGILLFAGSAAQADWNTSDNDGVLTGNQLDLSVDAPINICGNAVGVLGDATASCTINGGGGGAMEAGDWTSTGNDGVGTGNQIAVPVHTPINICGNAVGVLGDAGASCEIGGAGDAAGSYAASQSTESWTSSDNDGVLTGNQVAAIVSVPVNVCGNAVGVLGDAAASCTINGSGGGAMEAGDWTSTGNDGVLTGNQVAAILSVPVNVCGNALALLGDATASCEINGDGAGAGTGNNDDDYGTKARHGQHARKMHKESLPVVGDAASLGSLTKVLGGQREVARQARTEGWTSSDNDGVGVGNQLAVAVNLPLTIAGNAVGVAGDAVAAASA
jgi:hypothetical protein